MNEKRETLPLANCPYIRGKCCFRTKDRECTILIDTSFKDKMCHFRKETVDGENQYDKYLRRKEQEREKQNKKDLTNPWDYSIFKVSSQ